MLHPIGRSCYFGFLLALSTVLVCSGFDRICVADEITHFLEKTRVFSNEITLVSLAALTQYSHTFCHPKPKNIVICCLFQPITEFRKAMAAAFCLLRKVLTVNLADGFYSFCKCF